VGANVVAITTGTIGSNDASVIDFVDFDVAADGQVTLASDTDADMLTLNPSVALTADAIDVSAANIDNALNIGANDIEGTTGTITFTDFTVGADGQISVLSDTDADMLTFTPSVGQSNDAIDVSAANIDNALNIGANEIEGTDGLINFSDFDVVAEGFTTIAPDSDGDALAVTCAAVDCQALVVNATAADSTQTAGMIDLNFDTSTSTASGMNIAMTAVDDDAADTLYGIDMGVTIQEDTTSTDTVYGAYINVTQLDLSGSGIGLYINKAAASATGAAPMTAGLVIDNSDTDADGAGSDTAGILSDAIRISGTGAVDATISTGLDFDTTIITTDIELQNDETIDNNTNGTVAIKDGATTLISTNTTTTSVNLTDAQGGQRVCHDGSDAAIGVQAISDCGAGQADIAEYYDVVDDSTSGEVVVLSGESVERLNERYGMTSYAAVVRSFEPYQNTVIGIISTNPEGEILGEMSKEFMSNPQAVAVGGRVPVKVTNEGGAIAVGDLIVTSSTPGHGMKATQAGRVIGMALANFDGAEGTIMLQVMNTFYTPALDGNDLQGGNNTGLALVDGVLRVEGKLVVEDDAQFKGSVMVEDHIYGGKDIAGRARIKFGDTSVAVRFEQPYEYQPIITASPRAGSKMTGWWIEEESTTGFRITLESPLSWDVEFNWIAVGVSDGKISVSDGTIQGIELYVETQPSQPEPIVVDEQEPEQAPQDDQVIPEEQEQQEEVIEETQESEVDIEEDPVQTDEQVVDQESEQQAEVQEDEVVQE
jgi:hypothetical protein